MTDHRLGANKYSLRWLFVVSTAAALLLWNITEYSLARFLIGCFVLSVIGELVASKAEAGPHRETLILAACWGALPALFIAGPAVWRAFWSGNTGSVAVRGEITLFGYAVIVSIISVVLFVLCLWIGYAITTTIAFMQYLFGRLV